MILFRKRLLYWIVKEYIKRWGKTIFISFILGILFFFLLYLFSGYFISKIPIGHKETIGVVGDYTIDALPKFILSNLSVGLTTIRSDYSIAPGVARSYASKDNGRTYEFHLKPDIYFSDGTRLTSQDITYQFLDAAVERPNPETIIFKIKVKEPFAPFLTKVSYPIFKKGFVGIGQFKVRDIQINNSFVKKLTLVSVKNEYDVKIYKFYPTEEALQLAFLLGEDSKIIGLSTTKYQTTNFTSFPKISITKTTDYEHLISLFYNTQDKILSDKRLRLALTYALPSAFSQGQRSYYSYPSQAWYFEQSVNEPKQDIAHSKLLLSATEAATKSAGFTIELKVLRRYKSTADDVVKAWKEIGVHTNVKIVDTVPDIFQVFLGDFNLSPDPDQYSLWHSSQNNNITNFKSLRIDKLLEDGRTKLDIEERKKIYADFQKYLLDDAPASFLYFPYKYEIVRQ